MLFLLALEALEENERMAIERLYYDYSKRVKELSISIFHNDKHADDIVNDTFLKVIRYKDKFFGVSEEQCIRLIIICTRSVCFDLYSHNKKIRFESLDNFYEEDDDEGNTAQLEISDDSDLLKMMVDKETSAMLKNAINKLGDPARDIVILKFYYEIKNTEIAEFYKMNPSTVSTIIQRSINRLRRELGGYLNDRDK